MISSIIFVELLNFFNQHLEPEMANIWIVTKTWFHSASCSFKTPRHVAGCLSCPFKVG